MLELIKNNFWNASYLVGIVGFLSSIVSLFVDINGTVSIKWFLFAVLVGLYIIIVLLKICSEAIAGKQYLKNYETPIRLISEENILVIRRNENFINSMVVGIYSSNDDIEKLVALGFIHLVQDKIIQVRIYRTIGLAPLTQEIRTLKIKSVIPADVLLDITSGPQTTENTIGA